MIAAPSSQLQAWFSARNINAVFHLDGDGFAPQGDSPLTNFPDTVAWHLFAEGSFLFLDGGVLDLGLVRDSTLNATNDFQVFAESFENVAYIGDAGAYAIESTVCATGAASALVAVPCATVGS